MKVVSGKALCKVLERYGWVLERIKGSHHLYTKAGRVEILSVPVHGNRDLKRGTLGRLLKDAGLTEEDL